jgi:hypothetical protein
MMLVFTRRQNQVLVIAPYARFMAMRTSHATPFKSLAPGLHQFSK